MIVHPGVELDFEHSTAEIGGVTFPACFVELPMCDKDLDRVPCSTCVRKGGCFAGGAPWTWDDAWAHGCEFYVPLENGMLVNVAVAELRKALSTPATPVAPIEARKITLALLAPWCERELADRDAWILCYPRGIREAWLWEDCEPEWAAEHLQRLARTDVPFRPTDAMQPAKLVPISHPSIRPKENA